jgi:hypothetical protein
MEKSKSKASIDSNEWLSSERLLQRHKLNYEQNITLFEHNTIHPAKSPPSANSLFTTTPHPTSIFTFHQQQSCA